MIIKLLDNLPVKLSLTDTSLTLSALIAGGENRNIRIKKNKHKDS
jgi:hypothetical protein